MASALAGPAALGLLTVALAIVPAAVPAATIQWANVGSDWATGANWVGGVAPANGTTTDVAAFGSQGAIAVNPNLATARSIMGVNFLAGAYAYTVSGSTLTIGTGGISNAATNTETFSNSIITSNGQTWTTNAGGTLVLNGTVDLNATTTTSRTLTLASAGTTTFNGVIQNSFAGNLGCNLTFTGTGTVNLLNANTYSGTTTLRAGTLAAGSDAALGTGTFVFDNITGSTTTRIQSADATNRTFANAFGTFTGSNATFAFGATGTGSLTFSNTTAASIAGGARTFQIDSDTTFANGFTSTTGGSITKTGLATMTMNGASTYGGGTTVNAGTLTVGINGNLGATTGALTVNNPNTGATGTAVTVNLNSSQTVGSLSGTVATPVAGTNSATINLLGASTTLTINQATTTTYAGTFAGTIGNIEKTGAGTLTLTGANTHGGFTTVSGGTLVLANAGGGGASQNVSNIILNNGGTLLLGAANQIADSAQLTGGGGTLNTGGFSETMGALFLTASSTLDLASGASVFRFGSFTAGSTGILSILNWTGSVLGGGTDQVHIGALLAPGYTAAQLAQIQFVNPDGLAAGTYMATFAPTDASELVPGALVVVPEPATVAAGVLLLGALGWHQRRRFMSRRGTDKGGHRVIIKLDGSVATG